MTSQLIEYRVVSQVKWNEIWDNKPDNQRYKDIDSSMAKLGWVSQSDPDNIGSFLLTFGVYGMAVESMELDADRTGVSLTFEY